MSIDRCLGVRNPSMAGPHTGSDGEASLISYPFIDYFMNLQYIFYHHNNNIRKTWVTFFDYMQVLVEIPVRESCISPLT